MKKTVLISIEIDTDEYDDVSEDIDDVLNLAEEMLDGSADFPTEATIICDHMTRKVSLL